jgi:hypothetical protein
MSRRSKTVLAAAGCLATIGAAEAQTFGFGFANFLAVIMANGTTALGAGIQSSSHLSTGRYEIIFTREVSNCAIIAGPRGTAGGQISIFQNPADPTRVVAFTFSRTGAVTDLSFSLAVSCSSGGP